MKKEENTATNWITCEECQGRGKNSHRIRKKVRLHYQKELERFEKGGCKGIPPVKPKGHLLTCLKCAGSGLSPSENNPKPDTENYPHVAIIGGGIGGVALAVACLHRGIPFTLFERDNSFDARSQGYGLTLQQASKSIKGFGLLELEAGVFSTKHVVHATEGEVIVEWGMRMRSEEERQKPPKRTNIHIPRQSLRLALLEQLGENDVVQWGHQLLDYKEGKEGVSLSFQVDGKIKNIKADLVVGADGIRSVVRKSLIGKEVTPLRYLGCIVILGICSLESLKGLNSPLLDSATVFQTVNGNERVYMMPFSSDEVMWQFSFPILEEEAKALHNKGTKALKEEAYRRMQWHVPVPQIIAATKEEDITGYPVYDRELLQPELLQKGKHITLIGDAAHPMSPFKGQGANQALLDALALARGIALGCRPPQSQWRKVGIRESVLTEFEAEMLARSAVKVKDSAEAVKLLHSKVVLREGDGPKTRSLK